MQISFYTLSADDYLIVLSTEFIEIKCCYFDSLQKYLYKLVFVVLNVTN